MLCIYDYLISLIVSEIRKEVSIRGGVGNRGLMSPEWEFPICRKNMYDISYLIYHIISYHISLYY